MKETKCSFRETAKLGKHSYLRYILPSVVCVLLVVCCFVGLHIDADAAKPGGGVAFNKSCSRCGNTVTSSYAEPTCTNGGLFNYYCDYCGYFWTERGASALGHNYVNADTSATCTSSGTSGRTECSRCGNVGSSGTTVPATGHDWSTAYDCEELSYCLNCGQTGSYGPHSPVSSGNKSATCYSTGVYGRTECSVCGQVTNSGTTYGPVAHNYNYPTSCDHIMECQWCTSQTGTHQYSSKVTTAATCTSAGVTTYTCTGCTDSYTVAAPAAKGHSYADATCTAPKTCTSCGATTGSVNSSNHTGSSTYGGTSGVHTKYSCCGATISTSHSYTVDSGVQYSAATCTAARQNYKRCSCGYNPKSSSYVVSTGSVNSSNHTGSSTYGGTSGVHTKYSCCGATISTSHSYTVDSGVQYSAATCTVKRKNYLRCSCGYNPKSSSYVVETGSALGHSPNADDGDCTTPITCSRCGTTTTGAKSHTFTNAADATCNNSGCTYERAVGYTVVYNGNGHTGGSTASSTHVIDVAKALTANGFVKKYTITYNANGGSCSTANATGTYSFLGWATSAGGSKVYSDKQSVTNLGTAGSTVNLYAVWGSAPTVTLPTPTRTGYTFKGWYTAASGGTKVGAAGASYTVTSATTLYAQWEAISYKITYDEAGGSAVADLTYNINTNVTLAAAPTRAGYTFKGWKLASAVNNWSATTYSASQNIGTGKYGNITLVAQWEAISYKITYDEAGGSAVTDLTYNITTNVTLSAAPTRPGYTFAGWKLASAVNNWSATTYSASQAIGTGKYGNITLVAQWTANSYTMTYNPNGGAINPTTKSYSYGSILRMAAPTRTGYTFKNWYFNATGTNYLNLGRQYMYTDKISIHIDAYMDNWGLFGPGDMRLISCTEGGGWNIETNNASSDGCIVFTMYDAGVGYKTVTTSIKWSSLAPGWHSFDVRFDGRKMFASVDGSVVGTSANFLSGEIGYNETNAIFVGAEAGSDASVPTSGYFTGKIANVVISDSAVFILGARNKFATPVSDVTLIADWVANTYTVVYDGNDNTGGSTESSTHTYDVAKNLTPNGFTKTGWVFAGWNTKADGTGTAYADQASVKNLVSTAGGTITLYAQWTEETFDIDYDASGLGLPEGYKILTYIESTGTQYIKSGVKGAARWEFDIQFMDTTTRQLMGYGGNTSEYWGVQTNGKYGVTPTSQCTGTSAGNRDFVIHNYGEGGKYYLKKGADEVEVGVADVSAAEYTLFSIGGNYFCKARLYDLRVFQNGVLIRHFVPCESPDGVVGLYDVVGQAFYTNAGTGEFVPSETYPDEYTPDLAA